MILSPDGVYRIEFRIQNGLSLVFEYSFASSQFALVANTPKLRIDEDYWLLDVIDFLDGRQELYSNFWHMLDPKRIYRLWTCLGANYMNNDLVLSKYRFHFERAIRGETSKTYFESISRNLI